MKQGSQSSQGIMTEQYMARLSGHCFAQRGFTLIEVMVTVVIIALLAAIAYPSYTNYVIKASRQAAMTELTQLAGLQEKIYLNSNAYSISVTGYYNGTSNGGLGKPSGQTDDKKYTITITPNDVPGQAFMLTATPVPGKSQEDDGIISITSTGARSWGAQSW